MKGGCKSVIVMRLSDFVGGWFLGDFVPSVDRNEHVEICLKRYPKGQREPVHFQRLASEYTVIVSGYARMGDTVVGPDDIVCIPPGEACDFEALDDVTLIAVKTPSLPRDKVEGFPA